MTLDGYRDTLSPYDRRIFDQMYDFFVESAVQLLIEAEVSDCIIKTVISQHWNIPNDEFLSILQNEKVNATMRSLSEYLELNGFGEVKRKEFMLENKVRTKMLNEPDLLALRKNPEKIYKAVQRKAKK